MKARDEIIRNINDLEVKPQSTYVINRQSFNIYIFSHLVPKYFMDVEGKFKKSFILQIKKALRESKDESMAKLLDKLVTNPVEDWEISHLQEALTALYRSKYSFYDGLFKERI